MPRKAFADPDELDAMIRDLAQEKGLPDGICPDLVGPDPDNHGYWGSGNEEDHEQSCIWRGKLLAELRRRPGWRKAWRAEQELNRRIEALCEAGVSSPGKLILSMSAMALCLPLTGRPGPRRGRRRSSCGAS